MPTTYSPQLAADRLPVLEGEFAYAGGNAVSGDLGGGRWSAAIMDDTDADDYIRVGRQIPDGWNTMNVKMTFATKTTGTTGTNVRFWTYVSVADIGGDLATNRTQGFKDYTANATINIPGEVTVFSDVAVSPTELVSVTIGRNSSRAEDTFEGGSIGIIAVTIERAS